LKKDRKKAGPPSLVRPQHSYGVIVEILPSKLAELFFIFLDLLPKFTHTYPLAYREID
jgi:hypothetical protein